MTVTNFKACLALTLAFEGGYVNNPKDPGGATNQGVTQAVYNAYRNLVGLPSKSVTAISAGEVAAIYRQQYWAGVLGDKLPDGVDFATFDFAVNSGVARASRYLQLCVGAKPDGHLGAITLAAIQAADLEKLVIDLCASRVAFLKSLDTFSTFGVGWLRRVVGANSGYQTNDTGVIDYAVNMTRKTPQTLPQPKYIGALPDEPQTAKAISEDPTLPTSPLSYSDLKARR